MNASVSLACRSTRPTSSGTTPYPVDIELATNRRGSRNQLGFAVQLSLLRYPGFGLRIGEEVPEPLLGYLAYQLSIPTATFRDYSRRAQTRLDGSVANYSVTGLWYQPSRSCEAFRCSKAVISTVR